MDVLHAVGGAELGVEILVLLVLKGAPLLAAVVLLGRLIRDVGPTLRSHLWTCGAVALLLLPVLSMYLPGVGSGVVAYPESWIEGGPARAPLATWLLVAWAAGAAWLLARFAVDLARAARQTRRAEPCVDAGVRDAVAAARRRLDVRADVRVLVSATASTPFTWGWLRPVILLPEAASTWPAERLRAVVHHELAHVARRDFLVLVVLELARAVHWPNPLAWHLLDRAREDQEMASDLAAVRGGLDAPVYARQLVEMARGLVTSPPGAVLPVVRPSSLGPRVRCVMDARDRGRSVRRWTMAAVAVFVTGLAFPLAAVNAWDCPEDRPAVAGVSDAGSPVGGVDALRAPGPLRLSSFSPPTT